MGYMQLLDKDLVMFILEMKWKKYKKDFWRDGGFTNKKVILKLLLLLWALYTFARERGWIYKKSVKAKHIFLTGAGSGLGRSMTLKFAKRRANLTICDINEEGLQETKKMVREATGTDDNILMIKLDISNRQAIKDAAQQAIAKFNDVDILINNAGIVQGKQMMDMNENLTSKQFVVNLECHFWLIREFLPAMITRNEGQIVATSSMCAHAGQPNMTDYAAAKSGVVAMMEGLRLELKASGKNITVTCINPFFINTGMFEGTKGSYLFPFLKQEYVVNRMVNGILQNEEMVNIGWVQGQLIWFCRLLSNPAVYDHIARLFLGWNGMDEFKGRQEKNAIHKTGDQ